MRHSRATFIGLDSFRRAGDRAAYLPFPLFPLRVPFGPSIIVPGLAYLLLRLSALECLNSLADCMTYYALCCSVTSLLLELISSTYGSQLVAEFFGCGRQTSDAVLAHRKGDDFRHLPIH